MAEEKIEVDVEDAGGLDEEEDSTLTLLSMEDSSPEKFPINRKAAEMCKLVRSILEGDRSATEIPIKKK